MLQREMAATDSMAHHHQKTKKTYSGAYPDHSVEHRHTKPHFIRMWGPWFIAVVLTECDSTDARNPCDEDLAALCSADPCCPHSEHFPDGMVSEGSIRAFSRLACTAPNLATPVRVLQILQILQMLHA